MAATTTREQSHYHGLGVLLVILATVAWSTAGLFTKGLSADVWVINFWRGLFSALFILIYVIWRERGRTLACFASLGGPGWAAATVSSAATIAFLSAFKLTTVANVVVIYATAPFIAAAIAWLWLREKASGATLVASAVALFGVAIIMSGSLGSVNLTGDLLALLMTAGMALLIVLIRRYPDSPMVPAACVSALQLTVIGWCLSEPFTVPDGELVPLIGFGLVQAVAVVMLTEGARLIPAPVAALLGALEIPLAPIWVWLFLHEIPQTLTFIGGAIVLAGVAWHMWVERSSGGEGREPI